MTCEIIYGKVPGSDFIELAAPKDYQKTVPSRFPLILKLDYPSKSMGTSHPPIFCYTKGKRNEQEYNVLSCIKWFAGRLGNYFAQHLIFEKKDDLIAAGPAGPAWLIKRHTFYIETLNDWNERGKETENYDWRPIILPSNYRIGTGKEWGTHINKIIENIKEAWNGQDTQKKFVLKFDPNEHNDTDRLDPLYDLYALIDDDKRWNYQFCTFDGQRERDPPTWDIVFVADDKTSQKYQSKGYKHFNLKGDE